MIGYLTGYDRLKVFISMIVVASVILVGCGNISSPSGASSTTPVPVTDPQHLMIPRWFLSSLTLDGQDIAVAADQQNVNMQFAEGGKANGSGGCNGFSATFSANEEGQIAFGPIAATKMACDGIMETEYAYFEALSKVVQYSTEGGQLMLSSADGKTSLVFRMPPK